MDSGFIVAAVVLSVVALSAAIPLALAAKYRQAQRELSAKGATWVARAKVSQDSYAAGGALIARGSQDVPLDTALALVGDRLVVSPLTIGMYGVSARPFDVPLSRVQGVTVGVISFGWFKNRDTVTLRYSAPDVPPLDLVIVLTGLRQKRTLLAGPIGQFLAPASQ